MILIWPRISLNYCLVKYWLGWLLFLAELVGLIDRKLSISSALEGILLNSTDGGCLRDLF